jgi:predicted dehydrogenase
MSQAANIGICGCGFVSRFHVGALSGVPGARLVAVCDPDRHHADRLKTLAVRLRSGTNSVEIAVFESLDEMLRRNSLDVVHILTPPPLHFRQICTCLEAGVSVLAEKPFCLTADESRQLMSRARASGTMVATNHVMLWNPAFQALASGLASGRIGAPQHVCIHHRFSSRAIKRNITDHWSLQHPANLLFESLPHAASLVIRLLGRVIQANGRALGAGCVMALECERGSAQIDLCATAEYPEFLVDVFGEDGTAHADLGRNVVTTLAKSRYPHPVDDWAASLRTGGSTAWHAARNSLGYVCRFLARRPADAYSRSMSASIAHSYRLYRKEPGSPDWLDELREAAAVIEACELAVDAAARSGAQRNA